MTIESINGDVRVTMTPQEATELCRMLTTNAHTAHEESLRSRVAGRFIGAANAANAQRARVFEMVTHAGEKLAHEAMTDQRGTSPQDGDDNAC